MNVQQVLYNWVISPTHTKYLLALFPPLATINYWAPSRLVRKKFKNIKNPNKTAPPHPKINRKNYRYSISDLFEVITLLQGGNSPVNIPSYCPRGSLTIHRSHKLVSLAVRRVTLAGAMSGGAWRVWIFLEG